MNCILRELRGPGEAVRRTDRTMIRTAAHIPFATPEYTAGMDMARKNHGACMDYNMGPA